MIKVQMKRIRKSIIPFLLWKWLPAKDHFHCIFDFAPYIIKVDIPGAETHNFISFLIIIKIWIKISIYKYIGRVNFKMKQIFQNKPFDTDG